MAASADLSIAMDTNAGWGVAASDVMQDIQIARQFNGPRSSGNGGYTAGALAGSLESAGPVTVTLRRPPPLARVLSVVTGGGGNVLMDGADVIAEASIGEFDADPVGSVPFAEAAAAETHYFGLVGHPFPTCFTCGPERMPADGLCLRPGPLSEGRSACTWVPDRGFATGDGSNVRSETIWAALDCPSAWTTDVRADPGVLGQMTAQVLAPVTIGTSYVIVGQLLGRSGRKTSTATALYTVENELVARAEHVWISVDAEAFNALNS